jgi:hypothetical protein
VFVPHTPGTSRCAVGTWSLRFDRGSSSPDAEPVWSPLISRPQWSHWSASVNGFALSDRNQLPPMPRCPGCPPGLRLTVAGEHPATTGETSSAVPPHLFTQLGISACKAATCPEVLHLLPQ